MILIEPSDALDRWWPRWSKKSFSGWRKLDKTGTFREAFLSRTWSSKIVQTYRNEIGYTTVLLLYVGDKSCIVLWTAFFFCGSGFKLTFSRIALLLKRSQFDPKTDWNTNEILLYCLFGICFACSLFSVPGLISAWFAQVRPLWRHRRSFSMIIRGVFWSVL